MDRSPSGSEVAEIPAIVYPKVSVVIPVHNNADTLSHTLMAVKQQPYPGDMEIIVVDNNSSDRSVEIAQSIPGIIVTHQQAIQNAAATRNQGVAIATGDVIAFLDTDCLPSSDWLFQGIQALLQTGCDRVAGEIVVRPIAPNSSAVALLDTLYYFNQEKVVKTYGAAISANFLVKRSVIDTVGAFDTQFNELEDIEFGQRAMASGLSITYASQYLITHPPRTTLAQLWKKSSRYGQGIFTLCHQRSDWAGRWGWKHWLRPWRMLLFPRQLSWERLPFERNKIPWRKQLRIYGLIGLGINFPEAVGYVRAALDEMRVLR